MWTFTLGTNYEERINAASTLSKLKTADNLRNLSPMKHRKALHSYAFVACPPGNGADTHRVWEALYLNCIPIVFRSEFMERFAALGLPIWIVDSFEDLAGVTESDLREKYNQLESGFNHEALWMHFWIDKINISKSLSP
jgi:hypothetical protein